MKGRTGPPYASLTKPMRSYIASSVGAEAPRAFSAPSSRRRWSSPGSARSSRYRSWNGASSATTASATSSLNAP